MHTSLESLGSLKIRAVAIIRIYIYLVFVFCFFYVFLVSDVSLFVCLSSAYFVCCKNACVVCFTCIHAVLTSSTSVFVSYTSDLDPMPTSLLLDCLDVVLPSMTGIINDSFFLVSFHYSTNLLLLNYF